jgi:hypothetical protein
MTFVEQRQVLTLSAERRARRANFIQEVFHRGTERS